MIQLEMCSENNYDIYTTFINNMIAVDDDPSFQDEMCKLFDKTSDRLLKIHHLQMIFNSVNNYGSMCCTTE